MGAACCCEAEGVWGSPVAVHLPCCSACGEAAVGRWQQRCGLARCLPSSTGSSCCRCCTRLVQPSCLPRVTEPAPCCPLPSPAPLSLPSGDRDLYGAPLLVLANKHDVEGAASPAEVAELFGLQGTLEARACSVQAVTAKTGEGIKPAVQWLVESIKKSQRPELIRRRMLAQ